jgi:hypothetical protein
MNRSCRDGDCLRHQRRHHASGGGLDNGLSECGIWIDIRFTCSLSDITIVQAHGEWISRVMSEACACCEFFCKSYNFCNMKSIGTI